MRTRHRCSIPAIIAIASLLVVGQARSDDELDAHLAELKRQVDRPTTPLPRREQLTLQMASTLDRAAQASPSHAVRRECWTRATVVLDEFGREHRGHALAREFQLQAAVYAWASGRTWADDARLATSDPGPQAEAVRVLDGAIKRLEAIQPTGPDPVSENVRYRLARVVADRAELDPAGSGPRTSATERALALLDPPPTTPELVGFAQLLRSELLIRLGRIDLADRALAAAAGAKPAPPAADLARARIAALVGRGRHDDAAAEADRAPIDEVARAVSAIEVRVAQAVAETSGPGRAKAEADAIRRAVPLKDLTRPDARAAILDLARSIDEPGPEAAAEDWAVLADGQLRLGDVNRAADLAARGADRADATGRADRAAALRTRAGAILFQAGRFAEADLILTRVADDPAAGPDRIKAGLLRALARGRALAGRMPGATASRFVQALEAQIRAFPADTSAGEARWLLGLHMRAAGQIGRARAAWAEIPPGHPRRISARLAIADGFQAAVDDERLAEDPIRVGRKVDEARNSLDESLARAESGEEREALELRKARLLLDEVTSGRDQGRTIAERLIRTTTNPDHRDAARGLRLVAMAAAGPSHYLEAERAARELVAGSGQPEGWLATARLLDRVATGVDSDVNRRRLGLILKILVDRASERKASLTEAGRIEAKVRQARAFALTGSSTQARTALANLTPAARSLSDEQLRDLADAYARLEAHGLAVDIQRLRARNLQPASPAWFDARYAIALALYRSNQLDDARKLIDSTALIHPELGGGGLKVKFERLRQRLAPG